MLAFVRVGRGRFFMSTIGKRAPAAFFLLILTVAAMLLPQVASAAEPHTIVSNSGEWRDVYSTMLFASMTGRAATFLVSNRHSVLLADSLQPNSHLWLINSRTVPFAPGYANYLSGRGFTVENFDYDNVNLELAKRINTTSFIIVDDSYGYNAISVAPYAVASKSYVLFANAVNIDAIDAFLTDRKATSLLIYGHVDRQVKNALSKYNTETINLDGDRFANNIEIVKRYQAVSHTKQAILTNGEFIEQEIMSGKEPVIFIGKNNVPDVVQKYMGASDISVGVLIGNDLVNTATFIRRQIGISVFVKFARSAREPNSAITPVEALDMFFLPSYSISLEIESVSYNQATRQLEVVLHNPQSQAAYFKGTYTINNPGLPQQAVGDADTVFIEPNSYKTVTYFLDELAPDATISAYVIYGESKNSLENVIDEQYCLSCQKKISTVDIIDDCQVNMTGLSYNLPRKLFYADVDNTGTVSCYLTIELVDVIVAAEKVTYHLSEIAMLEPGEQKQLKIKGDLISEDIADNAQVKAAVYYGQRQNSLVKSFERSFPLAISSSAFSAVTLVSYIMIAVIALLAALITWRIAAARRRKRNK